MSGAATLEALDSLPPLPPPREIPTSIKDSMNSWWASTVHFEQESAASEERILRRIPSFLPAGIPTPTTFPHGVISRISRVPISSPSKAYLNTLSILPAATSEPVPTPVVMLHGYGAGLGFFFKNLPFLAEEWVNKRGGSLYAVDWLGMGRSARVPFRIKSKGTVEKVQEAESFFVDSLEEWRKAQNLEKMTLIGHSLGGYLSVCYALRHPERVSKLILLSPAGIPSSEYAHDVPSAELAHPVPPTSPGATNGAVVVASTNDSSTSVEQQQASDASDTAKYQSGAQRTSFMRRFGTFLWEQGVSPFSIVRWAGLYGPLLVSRYSSRRFAHLSQDDVRDMHNYLYHISRAKGSGEYCISHILAPGAYAYYPIVNRIQDLKVPVAFVYGDTDWMDPAGGLACIEKLKKMGNTDARMYVVDHAGHHVYLDNDEVTNKLTLAELEGKAYRGKARFA